MVPWSAQCHVHRCTARRNHTRGTPQYLESMPAWPLDEPTNLDRHELLELKIRVSEEPWEPFLTSRQAKHPEGRCFRRGARGRRVPSDGHIGA